MQKAHPKGVVITFFGGEPFLNFDIIKFIVRYVKNKYPNKKVAYSATTNGTIYNKEIMSFIQKNKIILLISFDGPEDLINENRPFENGKSSSKIVEENIKFYKKNKIPFNLRASIPSNCDKLIQIFKYFENQHVVFDSVFVFQSQNTTHNLANYNSQNLLRIDQQLSKLMDYYYDKFISGEMIFNETLVQGLISIDQNILSKVPCGAGQNTFSFNSDGNIYSCQNLAHFDDCSVGTIESGFNNTELKRYTPLNVERVSQCDSCWVRYLCSGGCIAQRYTHSKQMMNLPEEKCKLEKIRFANYLYLYQKLKDYDNDFIKKLKEN